MKMRGKMIDGSPVTFESIDLGGAMYRDVRTGEKCYLAPYVTEFVGEGFYVRSAWNGMAFPLKGVSANAYRLAYERAMLEQAGVFTATVEFLHCWDGKDGKGGETWELVWGLSEDFTGYSSDIQVELRRATRAWQAGEIGSGARTYVGTDYTISNAMMDAAMKELDGVLKRLVYVEHGRLVVSNPMRAVTLIWQAMMRAKKTGEAK